MGTSFIFIKFCNRIKDHPHAYGDKYRSCQSLHHRLGSSPRVWGQDKIAAQDTQITGIIPTRMGTSSSFRKRRLPYLDHPHAYGDKSIPLLQNITKLGSSPRVWGQVILEESYAEDFRIIPTRMGTSL